MIACYLSKIKSTVVYIVSNQRRLLKWKPRNGFRIEIYNKKIKNISF
jgi:hypothetical protein